MKVISILESVPGVPKSKGDYFQPVGCQKVVMNYLLMVHKISKKSLFQIHLFEYPRDSLPVLLSLLFPKRNISYFE